MWLIPIVRDLGIATTLMAAIAWVARSVALRWLDSRLDLFREQLRRETHEHQVRFESLHAKRAQALYDIWFALHAAKGALNDFTAPAQWGGHERQTQLGHTAGEAVEALRKATMPALIYFPKALADRLESFYRRLDSMWFGAVLDYQDSRESGQNPYFKPGSKDRSEFANTWHALKEQVDPVLRELEVEFRDLIGVEVRST